MSIGTDLLSDIFYSLHIKCKNLSIYKSFLGKKFFQVAGELRMNK